MAVFKPGNLMTGSSTGSYKMPRAQDRVIRSIELDNIPYQEIALENFANLLDIVNQGDAIYLYCVQFIPEKNKLLFDERTEELKIWIIRNAEIYNPSDMRGMYLKTVVIKDIAYHFFCNHQIQR